MISAGVGTQSTEGQEDRQEDQGVDADGEEDEGPSSGLSPIPGLGERSQQRSQTESESEETGPGRHGSLEAQGRKQVGDRGVTNRGECSPEARERVGEKPPWDPATGSHR